MSRKIVIPGATFSGTVLTDDPILTAGSLILLDVTHPVAQWPTVPPAADTRVPNLASATAALLTGASGADLDPLIATAGSPTARRTARGSLAVSRHSNGDGWHIRYPLPVISYIKANPSHVYGACLWVGLSGAGAGWGGIISLLTTDATSATDATKSVESLISCTKNSANSTGGKLSLKTQSTGDTGPRCITVQSGTSDDNQAAATLAQQASRITGVGTIGTALNPITSIVPPSELFFHRFVLEDLTVSGRTWQQLAALNEQMWAAEFSTGGRYNGDDYTL